MKYQEKLKLAEEGLESLINGKSIDEFKQELSNRKLYDSDISKVWRSLNSMLTEKHEEVFTKYILSNDLDSKRHEFSNLSDDVFNNIKIEVTENIRTNTKAKIKQLIAKGLDADEIIPMVENSVFSEEDIMEYGQIYYKDNVKVSGSEKQNYMVIGGLCIGIGIALTFYSLLNPFNGTSLLFGGLIIFGIIYIRKANSTKGEIEKMDQKI